MQVALHIFRRDLRLEDNTALNFALEQAKTVYPCFIFDPRQIERNRYKSSKAIHFMMHALSDLEMQLRNKGGRLYLFSGRADRVVEQLLSQNSIDLITFNRDYTPFALKRDQTIKSLCHSYGTEVQCFGDALLQEPENVLKENQKPYIKFTPFLNKAKTLPVRPPNNLSNTNFSREKLQGEIHASLETCGGRSEGLKLLKKIKNLGDYAKLRDFPSANCTSHLSPHNKFGTLSIREVYHKIRTTFSKEHLLIQELYWRDFFTHITFHFPHVIGGAFHQKYDAIAWSHNPKLFKAWCQGKTGFPIVDAGMRELNETGSMHNRVRMITASFLVKDLHLDWRLGERYFAQHLIDYDPAVNNGNWQWIASTGCDAQPYFRIFNPTTQLKRFDPNGEYIERWSDLSKCKPIVDHKSAAEQAKKLYKNLPVV
ncbi:MAG: Deoxyribodipyrimidine photo-lyase [Chlamydiales bacterium]|nr:Deoxyribodipyrimidine photo-lyase [Chlamydiales bacterium]MCH9636040.1 Deoxyribodipyrimidine photo-lyase [Chlamydiales bacterium]